MEKYVKDGMVAVIYSPGYGAGWSTWNYEHEELLSMDKRIVERVLEVGHLTKEWLRENIPELADAYIYDGGVNTPDNFGDRPMIEWVPEGKPFRIHEYDGYEEVIVGYPDYKVA